MLHEAARARGIPYYSTINYYTDGLPPTMEGGSHYRLRSRRSTIVAQNRSRALRKNHRARNM